MTEVPTLSVFDRPVLCAARATLAGEARKITTGQTAFFCNVHMLMLSRTDPVLAEAMDAANFVFPDGVPIAWLQRRLGRCEASVLRGYEALELICASAAASGKSIGILGSSDEVLTALTTRLQERFHGLQITYRHAPTQIAEDAPVDMSLVNAIIAAAPDFLFVGLGCPKQEKWILQHRQYLHCAMLGVGAALGWLAGTTPRPPQWMERVGLGWFFRLVREPRRLAGRYFFYNAKFVIAVAALLLFRRTSSIDALDR